MKKYLIYIGCFMMLNSMSSCDDFLDKEPLDLPVNDKYWVDETGLRAYSQDFYLTFFLGYGVDFRIFGGYYSGDSYNDDFLLTSDVSTDTDQRLFFPGTNITGINSVATPWTDQYAAVRKANVMIEKIEGMNITDEAKAHWTGIGRFFRALAYNELVKIYGDVPYIDRAADPAEDEIIYKERDERLTVVNKIRDDFEYALENVRNSDTPLQVNKYLVGALMSRSMLYHATWLKYHGTTVDPILKPVDNAELSKFFQSAINGAEVVMNSGSFSIGNTYNTLFSSESLAGNKEIIFYREYVSGLLSNALLAYNAKEDQKYGGATSAAIDSYVCKDGLPIKQSPLYKGKTDPSIKNSFQDRDPRIYDTFTDTLRILNSGVHSAGSPTGFAAKKFLNEELLATNSPYLTGLLSPIDAPVIRYAEVLLNYAEARYEIGKVGGAALNQSDIDKSINLIRQRSLNKWGEKPVVDRQLPKLALSAAGMSVDGTLIEDPDRDMEVDPVLWEIRRERRIELMMEGRRADDLNRWAKFEYLDTGGQGTPNKTCLGAWIKKTDYPKIKAEVKLFDPSKPNATDVNEGYINYFHKMSMGVGGIRSFDKTNLNSTRNYLRAIPSTQITIYKDKGYTLTQNPGW